jgi:hypothetical protein
MVENGAAETWTRGGEANNLQAKKLEDKFKFLTANWPLLGSKRVGKDSLSKETNSVALVSKRTIPTERPPLSAKLRPTFADRWCRLVSATDPHGSILSFLDRSRYIFIQVAAQLYARGWVNPVADPLLLRKSGRAENRTWDLWICSQELWPLDHREFIIN